MTQEVPKTANWGSKTIFVIPHTQNKEEMPTLPYILAMTDLNHNECQKPKRHTQTTTDLDLKSRIWTKFFLFPFFIQLMLCNTRSFQIYDENKEKSFLCTGLPHPILSLDFRYILCISILLKKTQRKSFHWNETFSHMKIISRHTIWAKKKGGSNVLFSSYGLDFDLNPNPDWVYALFRMVSSRNSSTKSVIFQAIAIFWHTMIIYQGKCANI